MGITQAEKHLTRSCRHAIDFLRNPCSQPLGSRSHNEHHHHDLDGIASGKQGAQVDEHPHPYQEVRYEEGIAHKFSSIHQRRNVRNEAVQHQSGQECPEDAFESGQFGQGCTEENECQHEDVLHDIVLVLAEEPTGKAGENQEHKSTIAHALAYKPYPRTRIELTPIHARDTRQHEQGHRKGKHGTPDGYGHRRMPRHAIAPHNGVCHQGVRCQNTGKQQRCAHTEPQQRHAYPHTDAKGDEEREHPEYKRLREVLLEVLQVHLQTGQEHDVVDTHLAEQLETAVALQDVETILAYHHAGQNHTDDVGDAQAAQEDRCKEYDHEHQEEYPSGVRDG